MKTALFFKLLFVCLACVAIRPVSAQVLGAGVFELKRTGCGLIDK